MTVEPDRSPTAAEDATTFGIAWPSLTIAGVSAASMALEIVAGRALAPYVGMSLYTWTVVIAVVLAGLSLGHWIGGWLADRTNRPALSVAWALSGAALTAFGCLAALQLAAPALAGADPIPHATALSMAAFFLPSAFAGIVSPLLTVIALTASRPGRRGNVLGIMFALGALGAIVGTLVAGLVLISWLGTAGSVALIGATYALLSLRFWRWRGTVASAAAIGCLGIAAVAWPAAFGLKSVCLKESAYFCIRVDDYLGFGRPARVMALDHLAHGVNDRANPRLLVVPYVQGIDELVAQRFSSPRMTAFFVGGGAYTLVRAWQSRYPEGRFLVAEIDPAVTEVAERNLWFERDAKTEIRHGDARQVLQTLPDGAKFDVVFGDAFHDISIPQHLVTHEFNQLVASRLEDGGIYALNVIDALRRPRFMLSVARTLNATFPSVELWIDRDSIEPDEIRTTWIILASDRPSTRDRLSAEYGFSREWARLPLDRMVAMFGPGELEFLTDDYAPVDRLLAPVLLNADLAETGGL